MKDEKNEKKQKVIIIILCILILLCLAVTMWALFFHGSDTVTPDYPPQGTEVNQTPIEGDTSEKMESPEGGGAINVTYKTEATVSLSDKTVSFYYANPGASNQNVAILIMIDDMVVAKSDLINPGNEVNELKLEDNAASKLQAGGYDAVLLVRAYNDDGEKAMVDTQGEINLTVQE